MSDNLSLFRQESLLNKRRPLADKLRPSTWSDFQSSGILDPNIVGRLQKGGGKLPSLVLWGPPGCGKTTLARLVGRTYDCNFVEFSAVLGGVKEVREIIAQAKMSVKSTLLFVDEIHRFNKAQQDAFLPHIEEGTISFIGATTENPSFSLNKALISRVKVISFDAHSEKALLAIAKKAVDSLKINFTEEALTFLCLSSGGDARRLLNTLESINDSSLSNLKEIQKEKLARFLGNNNSLAYDRSGEDHYNMVSAFIKSMRGSDADAALFWGFRMIESGEDPRYIIRRMMIFASEDIGNADPRALQVAVSVSDAYEKLGLPEGKIPIAHCITYLACAPKSNRSYSAMHDAIRAVHDNPKVTVPLHLRNAPTQLMKDLDYGKDYKYPHNLESAYVEDENYLPKEVSKAGWYEPSNRGYEKIIAERLRLLKR